MGEEAWLRLGRKGRIHGDDLCGADFSLRGTSVPPFRLCRAPQSGAEAPRRLKSAPHEWQPSKKLPERVVRLIQSGLVHAPI